MKKGFFKPLAVLALGAITIFGCAGTDQYSTTDDTTDPTAGVEVDADDNETVVNTDVDDASAEVEMESDGEVNVDIDADVDYSDMFEDIDDTKQYNVLALARMNPNLSTFVRLVEQSGLAASLDVAGPITVFAPTNQAFEGLTQERLQMLSDPQNIGELQALLQMHVIGSEVRAAELATQDLIDRGEGQEGITIRSDNNGRDLYIGGARVVRSNIETSNGVLHVVDGVIQANGMDQR